LAIRQNADVNPSSTIVRFIMMLFSLLINNYGAKIYKKIGKANFMAAKLKNVCIFLPHHDKLMPKWHE
jgi:hypothetical protein